VDIFLEGIHVKWEDRETTTHGGEERGIQYRAKAQIWGNHNPLPEGNGKEYCPDQNGCNVESKRPESPPAKLCRAGAI
jgi:hypothetical protein